jgi:hypothetical protein
MGRACAYLLLAALALSAAAGCGGDDGGGSGDDAARSEITAALETFFTTVDPIQCEQVTQRGLERFAPAVALAKDPVAECKKTLEPGSEAESIEVGDVSVDGEAATATVTPVGGSFAGTVVEVEFVNDGGWKLDGLGEVQIEDRDAYQAELDKAAGKSFGNDAFTSEQSACIADFIRNEVSTEELEESLASDAPSHIYDAVRFCLGGGTDTIAMVAILENQLVGSGVPKGEAECLAGASIAGHKGATLEEFQSSREIQERIIEAVEDAAQFCVKPRG